MKNNSEQNLLYPNKNILSFVKSIYFHLRYRLLAHVLLFNHMMLKKKQLTVADDN